MPSSTAICPRSAYTDPTESDMEFPSALEGIAEAFPTKLYLVGGAVRDALRGEKVEDYDLAGAATPEVVRETLTAAGYRVVDSSPRLGTLIIVAGGRHFEYTAFRTDSYPEGSGAHKPDKVVFTDDLGQDCRRRDFRCNAIYYDIKDRKLVDPLGGQEDVKARVLRTTRDAREVFCEDGLRIMRLVRFVSTLGFTPDDEATTAAKELVGRLADVSAERIREELDKTLAGKHVLDALHLARDTGAISVVIPELAANDGIAQPPAMHAYDVLEHSFRTTAAAREDIRLVALLHDVGKAVALERDGNMHNHALYGADMAEEVTKRLRYPNAVIEETKTLVAEHMYDINANAKEVKLRRFVARNHGHIDKLIALVRADSAGTGIFTDCPRADRFDATLAKMRADGVPFTVRELAVDGNDLKKFGLRGEKIGETQRTLLDACIEGRQKNEKSGLLALAARLAKSGNPTTRRSAAKEER